MKKKHIICLLVGVSITLMMLSCASRRSMMPRKHPHRCNDCPTFHIWLKTKIHMPVVKQTKEDKKQYYPLIFPLKLLIQ